MPAATLEKATHQLTRRSNERLVLRTVYEQAPLSRADVARATGLTRTTVSDVVEGLIDEGLAREMGVGPSTGGKAPILLEVPADARHLVGVDVDRDRLSGAIVNLRGEVRGAGLPGPGRPRRPCGAPRPDLARPELTRAAVEPLAGVGVGTPGLVDTASGHGALGGRTGVAGRAASVRGWPSSRACPSSSSTIRRPPPWANGPSAATTPRRP